jgi:Tol biopolymer transport system component/DNA-binding winged helix-turn-helix (wHTH) protein
MEHKPFVFTFGDFEVRESEFLLINGVDSVAVEPKAFRVLLFLLRNAGRVVGKDEIMTAVWDETAVSDNSLTRSIATLRRLLGDDSREPRYIATVQTIGYRFLCPVDVTGGPPHAEIEKSLPSEPLMQKSHRREMFFSVASGAVAILLAGGWMLNRAIIERAQAPMASQKDLASAQMRIVPFTNLSGQVWDPAFSPDARQIAFFWDGEDKGNGDLYVQRVGGDRPLRLTNSGSGFQRFPAWSPDGNSIAFLRCDDNGGSALIVPALGGPERRVTDVACPYGSVGHLNWTSDGESLILADRCVTNGPSGVVVFSMVTGAKHCLTAPPVVEEGDFDPILSPDEHTIAFIRMPTWGVSDIYTIGVGGGTPRRVTAENKGIWNIMWAQDGKSLSFVSSRGGLPRTWRVPATGGAISAETVYPQIGAISRDGTRLAYVDPPGFWHPAPVLWRADLTGRGGHVVTMRQLLPESGDSSAPQPSPDGREIAFESMRSGSAEVWKCNADGSNPLKLTSFEGHAGTPRWSPDGKWIAFDYRPKTTGEIFVIDAEGRNLRSVTSGAYENLVPSWSRDGKSIYFASNRTGSFQTWRHELASGRETQVTHNGGFAGFESYDGKTIYFSRFDGAGIWSVPVTGGEEHRITRAPHLGYWGHFAVVEDGLYIVDSDADRGPSILYYSFQSRSLSTVLTLEKGQRAVPWTANLSASRDGFTLFFAQGASKSSIVLVDHLQ